MEPLRNSLEVALYCAAREEGKGGDACRSDDFSGRDKIIFEAGHQHGKEAALRASISRPPLNYSPRMDG
jgi:hypothetical protein